MILFMKCSMPHGVIFVVHVPLFTEAVVHYGIVIGSKFENRKNGDERGQSVR